jgi:NitT/TauT family transport system permease protein
MSGAGATKHLYHILYSAIGVAGAILFWYLLTSLTVQNEQFSSALSPKNVFQALLELIPSADFRHHIMPSLQRVWLGLSIAIVLGVPTGLLIGYFSTLNKLTHLVFQFLRMISPLAWMPVAIILFGVGDGSVIFLIAMACIWPIIMGTAHGVVSVNPVWTRVVRMLGGGHSEIFLKAIIPAIMPDILAALRIALGLSWIVLVPAEMLGVSSGLGYFILDCRDRFNYSELGAVILVIGFLGFASDVAIRLLQRRYTWQSARGV